MGHLSLRHIENSPNGEESCLEIGYMLSHIQLFCDTLDCSPPGSSDHGTFLPRMLEWVAISPCKGCSQPREGIHVSCISCIASKFFTRWDFGEDLGDRIETSNVAMSDTHKLWLTVSQFPPLVYINITNQYLLYLLFCAELCSRHHYNNQNLPMNNISSLILPKHIRFLQKFCFGLV